MSNIKIGDAIILNELEGRKFIVTKIQEGGCGRIYFLKSLSFLPDCVLKTFKLTTTFDEFEKEAFSWAQLGGNPFIADFICYGTYKEMPYVLTKRYSDTFESLIGKNIDSNYAKELFGNIIHGLYYANTKINLIHRDIKPGNIFLDNKTPKIGDFGLSEYSRFSYTENNEKSVTKSIEKVDAPYGGTIHFMAPELFNKNPVYSVSTDLFALGVTFFLIYSDGLFPYDVIQHKIFTDSFSAFDKNCKDQVLKEVILKCISLDKNRYQSYEEIPLFKKVYPEKTEEEVKEIVNTVQLLKRQNKLSEALNYAKDKLMEFPEHPWVLNQIAILYRIQKNDKVFEFILSDLFENDKLNYNPVFYLDPLFTLANHYFSRDDKVAFTEVIDNFLMKSKISEESLSLYPEFGIYLALKGFNEKAFTVLSTVIVNTFFPPKYWLFFCCVCKKTNKYEALKNILATKSGEFENILKDDVKNIDRFEELIEQCKMKYKEFMNAIF